MKEHRSSQLLPTVAASSLLGEGGATRDLLRTQERSRQLSPTTYKNQTTTQTTVVRRNQSKGHHAQKIGCQLG